MEIVTLESVLLPMHCTDIDFLRHHPNLKRLSYKKSTQSTEEFWKEFDDSKANPQRSTQPPPKPAP